MTSAEHIRQVADRLGYWTAPDAAARLKLRRLIQHQYPYTRQAIADALKRCSQPGRPRKPRCPQCGQPMPRETAAK